MVPFSDRNDAYQSCIFFILRSSYRILLFPLAVVECCALFSFLSPQNDEYYKNAEREERLRMQALEVEKLLNDAGVAPKVL